MITLEKIISESKPHGIRDGKYVLYGNDKILFSVVGGSSGLYGDFIETFELAIIDPITKEFLTKEYLDIDDDVYPYISGEKLVKISNEILGDSFQFL